VGLDASNGRPRDRGGEGDLVPRAARGPVSQGRRDSISSEGGGTEVLVGMAPSIQGAGRFRAPDAFIADGAISASLRCPTQAKGGYGARRGQWETERPRW